MDPAFRNIQPMGRQQRAALKDNEQLQKDRLQQRVGNHEKYENPGNFIQPIEGSAHRESDQSRFAKDFAAEDAIRREEERKHR
jgi:hypothetical protein